MARRARAVLVELKSRAVEARFVRSMAPARKKPSSPVRHSDPDAAIAFYLEELRQAELAGTGTPAAALNRLGDAHLDKGDVVSAVDYYRQAAEVYEREGIHDNAIACCKKIRRYAPEDEDVALMLGRYYAAKGLRADAVAELEAYAERRARAGRPEEAAEALREALRLAPERGALREALARVGGIAERIEEKPAVEPAFETPEFEIMPGRPDLEVVPGRTDSENGTAPPEPPARPAKPEPETWDEQEAIAEAAPAEASFDEPAVDLGIERTSYAEEESPSETSEPPPAEIEIEETSAHAEPSEEPLPEPDSDDPEGAFAVAERLASDGRFERAGRYLVAAAGGYRRAHRWTEAVAAYRRLAQLEQATPDDFAAWAECARQAGEASKVLEALAVTARWHLARGDRQGARRAAEEMLLVDPTSAVATDMLERVGTSLPRG